VDLQTLVDLIQQKVTNPPVEKAEDLREVFRLYDKEGRGFVSVAEMRHLLTSVGEKLTDDEAEELLRMSGCVHNNMVQYDSKFCLIDRIQYNRAVVALIFLKALMHCINFLTH